MNCSCMKKYFIYLFFLISIFFRNLSKLPTATSGRYYSRVLTSRLLIRVTSRLEIVYVSFWWRIFITPRLLTLRWDSVLTLVLTFFHWLKIVNASIIIVPFIRNIVQIASLMLLHAVKCIVLWVSFCLFTVWTPTSREFGNINISERVRYFLFVSIRLLLLF